MQQRKRTRDALESPLGGPQDMGMPGMPQPLHHDDAFIQDRDAGESGGDDDDDDDKPKDKKAGRRKIKIEFIQDKSRRHITFSKRKAGIMKKAYELSTLTGTQVLLLVVSETGLVYTFTTAKLQPLVTQPEGKNLIQACLNAPQGTLPSSMPIGPPIGRSSGPPPPMGNAGPPSSASGGSNNLPGGLSIGSQQSSSSHSAGGGGHSSKDDDLDNNGPDPDRTKRQRRESTGASNAPGNPRSPNQSHASISPSPLSMSGAGQSSGGGQQSMGGSNMSPTSPQQSHATSANQYSPPGSYAHAGSHSHDGGGMYGGQQQQHGHSMLQYSSYGGSQSNQSGGGGGASGGGGGGPPLGGLAAAAAQQHGHTHWSQAPPGPPYVRR